MTRSLSYGCKSADGVTTEQGSSEVRINTG